MGRTIVVTLPVLGLLVTSLELAAQVGSMRVTVPSPTAASLGKFGDIPVSLYTGVPDISIPLFTARGKTLELPIALKYHASGIRVEEIGGWVGIGWTLEAGGSITRTVRGLADEVSGGYHSTGDMWYNSSNWPTPSNPTIDLVTSEQLDGEPDQFFFSFAGRSGQFVMGPTSSSPTLKEYRAIPHQKLRIQPSLDFASWEITTEDGTRYTFAARETNTDWNLTQGSSQIPAKYGVSHTSAWHLTEIRSPGGDVITLGYAAYSARHRVGSYVEKFDQVVTGPGQPSPCVPSQFDVINEYTVDGLQLSSITTAAHVVAFTTTLRTDALNPLNSAQQELRLDKVIVRTPGGVVLRQYQFAHDYTLGGRLTLKNVYEQDRNGISLPPYSFVYDAQQLPSLTSYSQDHWGYFNGQANTTLVPAGITPSGSAAPGADRSPAPALARAGVLTKITYPTGGFSQFTFEANDYGALSFTGAVPYDWGTPLSIEARSTAFQGPQNTTFTVGGSATTIATVSVSLDPACGQQIGCAWAQIAGAGGGGFWSTPGQYFVALAPGSYTATASEEYNTNGFALITVTWREWWPAQNGGITGKVGGGLRVAEIQTADAMGNVTIRKYKYTLQSDPTRSSGVGGIEPDYDYSYNTPQCSYYSRSSMSKMPLGGGPAVGYREVTVWHGATGEFGKTRHTFRSALDAWDIGPLPGRWPFSTPTSYEWARGQQTGSSEYSAAGQPQRQSTSSHTIKGNPVTDPITARRFRGMSLNAFSAGGSGGTAYAYNEFEVISGWAFQNSETTTVYDTTGTTSFSTSKTFAYSNPDHLQVTEVTETNSDGTQRITRMKYPADYATASSGDEGLALNAMRTTAHIHSAVIERWVVEKVGTTEKIVEAQLTTFKQYATGQYLPYQRFVLNSPSPVQ